MRCLFLSPAQLRDDLIPIDGPDFHHLVNVLRVRIGEPLLLLDGEGGAWYAEVSEVGKRSLNARKVGEAETAPEPAVHITVAQALGKGDKFEQVIQHATEIGASAFIPLLTERTVVRLGAKDEANKLDRWRLIAKGAAEQSGRSRIPTVEPPASLETLLARVSAFSSALLLHPTGEPITSSPPHLLTSPLLLLVGPEGGFSDAEVERARNANARILSLGPYVLRTETAALVAISQILFAASLQRP